ncbi:Type IV pili methyl-accepting chemotaxis transducer N-term [Candidatus Electrothrix aarhusensis]|uniref:Type IV pili methyl-accepting chemotaxis transducer N-term n=1 Tax=Candidatus Electrothrix aarhusensis TaxID=1859131 RepID=A0A444IWG2_9BACT|nr:Type IV pili methyl-accepting chemotaxis transducer N-term [Candidatus Electrothrix aarhusensis]
MKRKHSGKKHTYLAVRYLLTLTAFTTLFFCSEVSANASAKDVHEMADICMQANRILKDYALVGMGVKHHDPAQDLKENLEIIEKEIKDLEGHKQNEKITAEIVEIEKSWHAIKPEFEKTPGKSKMHDLFVMVGNFTDRCEEIADDIAKDTGIKGEHNVVLVAELGMESQRMAALYLIKAWGVDDPDYEKEVKNIVEQTEKIYKELLEADEKLVSKEIKEQLQKVEKDFIAFSVMATSTTGRFMPSAAEKMATKIFKALRDILKKEQKLVEGTVSGYFTPIADEKTAGEIFRVLTEIVHVKGEIGS